MTFQEYQALVERTQMKDKAKDELLAMVGLGLTGEAGECVDLLKKHLFHGHPLDVAKLKKEIGDVLWYVAALASLVALPLEEVAIENIEKLKARYPDGFTVQASLQRQDTDA